MLSVTTNDEKTRSTTLLPALEHQCRYFSMAELNSATDNFDEKWCIGRGGFGKVYKGKISNDPTNICAIKRLHFMSNQGATEFWNEVEMLSRLRHCNIVPLIGYCNEGKEMALVYEYMHNGTLYDHLHKKDTILTWSQRLRICIGAARGLDYLHTGTGTKQGVIHRDVKSSNILLDRDYAAKIADFGLAKIMPLNQTCSHVSTEVKGSFGYMDPNYVHTGRLTIESDVYAFGVVLVEVLSGRLASDGNLDQGLAVWAQGLIKRGKVRQIIDPRLRDDISKSSLNEFSRIARRCLTCHTKRPKRRPTMTEVVASLYRALSFQTRKASPNKGWITINNVWKFLKHKGPLKVRRSRANQRKALKGQDVKQSRSNVGSTYSLPSQINALSLNSPKGGCGSRVELEHVYMIAEVPTQEVGNQALHTRNQAYDRRNNDADQVERVWDEQYEPGVLVSFMILRDGTKDIRKIRFSRKKFSKRKAKIWWLKNHKKVCKKYEVSRFAVS